MKNEEWGCAYEGKLMKHGLQKLKQVLRKLIKLKHVFDRKNGEMFGGIIFYQYLCGVNYKRKVMTMNTVTINTDTYKAAEAYAKSRNVSIDALVERLLESVVSKSNKKEKRKYYISPKIESLRVGFKCPGGSSFDYKSELRDILTDRYL